MHKVACIIFVLADRGYYTQKQAYHDVTLLTGAKHAIIGDTEQTVFQFTKWSSPAASLAFHVT